MKKLVIVLGACFFAGHVYAQTEVPLFGKVNLLNGYVRTDAGQTLAYNSAVPRVAKDALLTRCADGRMVYGWYTEPVPDSLQADFIYFAWLGAYSSGTSHAEARFDLAINGQKQLTIQTFPRDSSDHWFYGADTGVAVVFKRLMLDRNQDVHGWMVLRVPVRAFPAGKPLHLTMTGQALSTRDWMMTFKYSYTNKVLVTPMPFLIKREDKLYQSVYLEFDQVSVAELVTVSIKGHLDIAHQLPPGYSDLEIPIPAITTAQPLEVIIHRKDGTEELINLVLEPVARREIHLIHHSHQDLGYTHRQEEVIAKQVQHIRDALRLIEDTKLYPPETRFRWNIENMWAVDHYFRSTDKVERNQFLTAVDQGTIALTGLYANTLTGLSLPEEMMAWTDYAKWFAKEYKVEFPVTAMISDIPGLSWGGITALAHQGVKYFSSGPNAFDRIGASSQYWADKPFYWVTPAGQKVLFWLAGKGYSSWHGTSPGDIVREGKERIGNYLNELQAQKYSFDQVLWRYNIGADNGGVDSTLADFASLWNQEYESPKLRVSNINDFFKKFEDKYGAQLPHYSGDMSPYWEDGAYSSAAETGEVRSAAEKIARIQNVAPFLKPELDLNPEIYTVWENIMYFNEHTWGAFNSVSEPEGPLQKDSWAYKQAFAIAAKQLTKTLEPTVFHDPSMVAADSLLILNSCYGDQDGLVQVPGDFYRQQATLISSDSTIIPWQILPNNVLLLKTDHVPAWSTTTVKWVPWDSLFVEKTNSFEVDGNEFSNGLISIKLSEQDGSIVRIRERHGKIIYQHDGDNGGLNTYWYVQGLDPQAVQKVTKVNIQVIETGPVRLLIRITSPAPGCRSLVREIILKKDDSRIYLVNTLDKTPIKQKEAGYFNFPFHSKKPRITYDTGWGPCRAGLDQLPGSNCDFLAVCRWIDYSEHNHGFTLLNRQAALFTLGDRVNENTSGTGVKTWREDWPNPGGLTAYVFNNYWHTNYKADQEGPITYEFVLVPHAMFSVSSAYQEAQRWNNPLTFRYSALPKNYPSPITLNNPHIQVSAVQRIGNNYRYRLFNTSPARQEVFITQPDGRRATIRLNGARQFGVNSALTLAIPGFGISELEMDFTK